MFSKTTSISVNHLQIHVSPPLVVFLTRKMVFAVKIKLASIKLLLIIPENVNSVSFISLWMILVRSL